MLTAILITLIVICVLLFSIDRMLGASAQMQARMVDTLSKNMEAIDKILYSANQISEKLDPIHALTRRMEDERRKTESAGLQK